MTDPEVRFDQLMAALKERNFRLSPQRVELVRMIAVCAKTALPAFDLHEL